MNIKKTLQIPNQGATTEICFGVADSNDYDAVFALRHKVYHKHGYFSEEIEPGEHMRDIDQYDTESTDYVCAYIGTRLLGCLRLVYGPDMPILKYFSIEQSELQHIPLDATFEIGRLVIHREQEDRNIPKNIVTMMMFMVAADIATEKNIPIAVAYIKQKLLGKLSLLRLKVHTMHNFECVYPRDGKMFRYFYNAEDKPIPSWISLNEASKFCNGILSNTSLFTEVRPSVYALKQSLYEKFLRSLGIL